MKLIPHYFLGLPVNDGPYVLFGPNRERKEWEASYSLDEILAHCVRVLEPIVGPDNKVLLERRTGIPYDAPPIYHFWEVSKK